MKKIDCKDFQMPKYLCRMKAERGEALYQQIVSELVVKERYLEPNLTAYSLAEELHTNPRYVSAVMSLRFNGTFNATVNRYRIQRAIYMMKDKRYAELNCEDIGALCGFANRQSFYSAFHKNMGQTPAAYKKALTNNNKE